MYTTADSAFSPIQRTSFIGAFIVAGVLLFWPMCGQVPATVSDAVDRSESAKASAIRAFNRNDYRTALEDSGRCLEAIRKAESLADDFQMKEFICTFVSLPTGGAPCFTLRPALHSPHSSRTRIETLYEFAASRFRSSAKRSASLKPAPYHNTCVALTFLLLGSELALNRTARGADELFGGSGGTEFKHAPGNGFVLVGLKVTAGKFNSYHLVTSVQPVYRNTAGQVVEGPVYGNISGSKKTLGCDPKLRVESVVVRSGIYLDAVKLRLTAADANDGTTPPKETEWVGGRAGAEHVLGDRLYPIVGIRGRAASIIDAIGILQGPNTNKTAGNATQTSLVEEQLAATVRSDAAFKGRAAAILIRSNGFRIDGQLLELNSKQVRIQQARRPKPLELKAEDVRVVQTPNDTYTYDPAAKGFRSAQREAERARAIVRQNEDRARENAISRDRAVNLHVTLVANGGLGSETARRTQKFEQRGILKEIRKDQSLVLVGQVGDQTRLQTMTFRPGTIEEVYLGNESEWIRRSTDFPEGAQSHYLTWNGEQQIWNGAQIRKATADFLVPLWICEQPKGRRLGYVRQASKREKGNLTIDDVIANWVATGDEQASKLEYTWTPDEEDLVKLLDALDVVRQLAELGRGSQPSFSGGVPDKPAEKGDTVKPTAGRRSVTVTGICRGYVKGTTLLRWRTDGLGEIFFPSSTVRFVDVHGRFELECSAGDYIYIMNQDKTTILWKGKVDSNMDIGEI